MSYAPKSLQELAAYWVSQGGINSGIVGNAAHVKGYHLGRDRIFSSTGMGWHDYSIQYERDKAGLTNASSAIDLGKLDNSLPALYKFSQWLVARSLAKMAGTEWIREIIYSPDGKNVQRFSGADFQIHTGPGNGDNSHLWHTHISAWRDTENDDKIAAFKPYFTPVASTGGDMAITAGGLALSSSHQIVGVPIGTVCYDDPACTKPRTKLSRPSDLAYFGIPQGASAYAVLISTATGFSDGVTRPVIVYVKRVGLASPTPKPVAPPPPPPADSTPFDQEDLNAAKAAGYNAGVVDGKTAGLKVGREEGWDKAKSQAIAAVTAIPNDFI